jgi:hypothetical protein
LDMSVDMIHRENLARQRVCRRTLSSSSVFHALHTVNTIHAILKSIISIFYSISTCLHRVQATPYGVHGSGDFYVAGVRKATPAEPLQIWENVTSTSGRLSSSLWRTSAILQRSSKISCICCSQWQTEDSCETRTP